MADLSNQNPVADIQAKIVALSGDKGWAISCYIPVFNIVTCVLCSIKMVNSKFCLFHARQGLALFAFWFFTTIVISIISPLVSLMTLGLVIALHIAGMVIAYGGKVTEIPIIGTFAMKIPEDYIFKMLTGKILDKNVAASSVAAQSPAIPPVSPANPVDTTKS